MIKSPDKIGRRTSRAQRDEDGGHAWCSAINVTGRSPPRACRAVLWHATRPGGSSNISDSWHGRHRPASPSTAASRVRSKPSRWRWPPTLIDAGVPVTPSHPAPSIHVGRPAFSAGPPRFGWRRRPDSRRAAAAWPYGHSQRGRAGGLLPRRSVAGSTTAWSASPFEGGHSGTAACGVAPC